MALSGYMGVVMNFDVAIIGGGLSGLVAGIKLQQAGAHSVIVAKGAPGLSFSSGNIDLFRGQDPWQEIAHLPSHHPYGKIGLEGTKQALDWLHNLVAGEGMAMIRCQEGNGRVYTPYGRSKESFLLQPSMAHPMLAGRKVAVVQIEHFQDFPVQFLRDGLLEHSGAREVTVSSLDIGLPSRYFLFRSKEISRALSHKKRWQVFVERIAEIAQNVDIIFAPAILPMDELFASYWYEISKASGEKFFEIPTSPPSITGERLLHFLRQAYQNRGGTLYDNRKVVAVDWHENDKRGIAALRVAEFLQPLRARDYVLATGSFFSNGLESRSDSVFEPLVGADVYALPETSEWTHKDFKRFAEQKFLSFGVESDSSLRMLKQGMVVDNLYAAGAVLSRFNPLAEGSAGGVSVSTAYAAASHIERGWR